jgi:stage V sporulation protein R
MVWEYYVKSKKAEDYKAMLIDTLLHPPDIRVDHGKTLQGPLYLVHRFEGKPLKVDYIENTMAGIEFLWGGSVRLETWEVGKSSSSSQRPGNFWDPVDPKAKGDGAGKKLSWKQVLYIMENRKLHKREM